MVRATLPLLGLLRCLSRMLAIRARGEKIFRDEKHENIQFRIVCVGLKTLLQCSARIKNNSFISETNSVRYQMKLSDHR